MDESETGSVQSNPDQHSRNSQTTNLRQPFDPQSVRNPIRLERPKRKERLRASRLHANQGSLEPRRPGVEKPSRARNELPCFE
ncbi:unnamed protein product [Sphagnum jensenii]